MNEVKHETISLRLPTELKDKLKADAAKMGRELGIRITTSQMALRYLRAGMAKGAQK